MAPAPAKVRYERTRMRYTSSKKRLEERGGQSMQKRTSRTSRSRTKHRRTVQNRAANVTASKSLGPTDARGESISTAAAARKLGVDVRTIRRYVENGTLHASHTPGGHVRIVAADVEAIITTGHPNSSTPMP